ncbi:MAG: MerR family transcriptional regulator [Gelidibacter sp.]|nr:MerR family transcriptional regulator [Gelidibacter sp.]
MNNIKSNFSIKDLENLSGIKAHTIRIWEKRYNLLEPERTDTNIRYYNLSSLQKLMNVSFLNENGYKISKIAALQKDKIPALVREIALKSNENNYAIQSFKFAMLNFDQFLFYDTYNKLAKEKTFKSIFYDVFIPLLSEIGLLWQTDTITPAHEHFISTLIRQKIIASTETFQSANQNDSTKTFVLFLPDNEVHELGLMFVNHEIISKGYHSILLGQSVPMNSLLDLLNHYDDVTYVSYFTIKPEKDDIESYLNEFEEKIISKGTSKLWVLGKMLEHIDTDSLPKKIRAFKSIDEIVEEL